MEAAAGRDQYKDFEVNSEQESQEEVQEMNTINILLASTNSRMPDTYRK